jgi:hypothetical protein
MPGTATDTRRVAAGSLALVLALTLGLTAGAGAAEAKKKKKKKGRTAEVTRAVNAPIPDGSAAADGELSVTITLGKQFRGLQIRDVDVTVQTTGNAAQSGNDLIGQLSAPNVASSSIFYNLFGQSIGPLTLDDEADRVLANNAPPPASPTSNYFLYAPYIGRAQPGISVLGNELSVMDGGPARGTWTLRIFDTQGADTSVLNSWRLRVVAGRPFRTK